MAMKKCKDCGKEVSTSAKLCPHCGRKYPTGGLTLPAKIFLVILALFALGKVIGEMGSSSTSTTDAPPQRTELNTKDAIRPLLYLDFKWGKGGLDNIMMANFVINNLSDKDIKDITITCTHNAKSGTKIDDNTRTIYDVVKAHSKKQVNKFNMGFIHSQANSSSCRITDFEFN